MLENCLVFIFSKLFLYHAMYKHTHTHTNTITHIYMCAIFQIHQTPCKRLLTSALSSQLDVLHRVEQYYSLGLS